MSSCVCFVLIVLNFMVIDIVYDFRAQLQGTGSWSEVLYD